MTFSVQQINAMKDILKAEALIEAANNNLAVHLKTIKRLEEQPQSKVVESQLTFPRGEVEKLKRNIPRLEQKMSESKTELKSLTEKQLQELRVQVKVMLEKSVDKNAGEKEESSVETNHNAISFSPVSFAKSLRRRWSDQKSRSDSELPVQDGTSESSALITNPARRSLNLGKSSSSN